MNFEMAKKLKEAGFPEGNNGCIYINPKLRGFPEGWQINKFYKEKLKEKIKDLEEHGIYSPTLSELIEACGDNFMTLVKIHPENKWWEGKKYFAVGYDERSKSLRYIPSAVSSQLHFDGDTPEEAIALLWLALKEIGLQRIDEMGKV